jgi:mannose-1-phosphate guanylyltransferase / mannose-6-phosphate isomerase
MLIPVILSGGAGTRLWPVSRSTFPKPFLALADGENLLSKTLKRALAVASPGAVYTLTNRDHYFLTRDVYAPLLDSDRQHYLLEPQGRNTAPALLLAAIAIAERFGPHAQLLALAADHLIADVEAFKADVARASALAEQRFLVTFGIKPTRPETGFGYIEVGSELLSNQGAHAEQHPRQVLGQLIERFVEKPDNATAQQYLDSGKFVWNSGMFCMRADTLLETAQLVAPELLAQVEAVWKATKTGQEPIAFTPELFATLNDISFDYAIMEHATRRAVVLASFDWNDIGSWNSISELSTADARGNATQGNAILVDSDNCFVQAGKRLVAAVGVQDLVVIETDDAVLISHRTQVQNVKQVVAELRTKNPSLASHHSTVHRPWGSYTVLEDGDDCKVKRLIVKPGQVLSLQLHHRRSEHWVVVKGRAKVTVGEREIMLETNESVEIPVNTKHRLENTTNEPIALIEVQCGSYFGEDDIIRFEDRYGRV